MAPWWERIPGRLEYELAALEADGIRVQRDDEAFQRGTLRLTLTLPDGGWPASRLLAVYPDTFPRTRPEVFAIDVVLDHHQNPFAKNLCLLGRATSNWRPSDTLAGLLRAQLPLLRRALESPNPGEFEEQQGEPITTFYEYEPGGIVFVDSGWALPPDALSGRFQIALLNGKGPLRGVVTVLGDLAGRPLVPGPFCPGSAQKQNGMWFRLDQPIVENDPAKFVRALSQVHSGVGAALRRDEVIGVVFPEETSHRRKSDGWLFLRRHTSGNKNRSAAGTTFVRAGRIGLADVAARFPRFKQLQDRGIAVFGLGCIGAPSLLEFARSGVRRLRFLDADLVEAGTIVRWPLGLSAAGWPKAIVLANFIAREYPWVAITARGHRIGGIDQDPSDNAVFEEFLLEDIDVLYDATAEIGLQDVLSSLARERGIPYICVSAVAGGIGGVVARLDPPRTGCWWCLQKAIDEGTIAIPVASDGSSVQPQGCAAITYIGADHDLQEIALQGVRLAIATLARDGSDYKWDVGVVRLQGEEGEPVAPQWSTYKLSRHAECPVCNQP